MNKAIELQEVRRRKTLSVAGDRPVIQVTTALHEVTDAAVAALGGDETLYQRDGRIARFVRVAESEKQARDLAGTPTVRDAGVATVRERLAAAADWTRFDSRNDVWVATNPPDPVVQAVLARGEYPSLRPLTGIAEAPFMRPDGTICDVPGYDSATGYLYIPGIEFPKVSEAPTQEEAGKALVELTEVWADFPFVEGAHRMVPIAALLTLLARPAIEGSVPAFQIDASAPGTGKTLTVDAVSLIARGRTAPKMTWTDDPAELEKVLASFALSGSPIVAFDNVSIAFGGAALDKVLTAGDTVQLRILGRSEVPALKWRAVVMATGNNMVTVGDTTRRVLLGRLECAEENPEERETFNHHPLLTWVAENRGRLVSAGLTILRAWAVDGRKSHGCKSWGSFEAWSATVPPAIVYAGGADPLACRPVALGEESPEKAALRTILGTWPAFAPEGVSAKKAIDYLWPAELRGQTPCDGNDALREAIETLANAVPGKPPTARRLGDAFRKLKGRVVGGARLINHPDRNGIGVWQVASAGSTGCAGSVSTPSRVSWQTSPGDSVGGDPADTVDPAFWDVEGCE